MTPEEAGVYGVRSVIRSLGGGPPLGLSKRSKTKHPRPSTAGMLPTEEQQPSRLAEMAEGRPLGANGEEAGRNKRRYKRKTERRRFY